MGIHRRDQHSLQQSTPKQLAGLQECGALINYDLPWNPMRVEQRTGRIDRIGLFENVVGDMQPILSGVSQQIRDATLNTEHSERQTAVEHADKQLSAKYRTTRTRRPR